MSGKGYCSVKLDKRFSDDIIKLLKVAGIEHIEKKSLHVTIMYDKSNPEIEVPNLDTKRIFIAEITGVEALGKAIVLKLKSKELNSRFNELTKLGFKHSFDEYIIHMSLVYDPSDIDLDLISLIYNLGLFPKNLAFSNETWEKLE